MVVPATAEIVAADIIALTADSVMPGDVREIRYAFTADPSVNLFAKQADGSDLPAVPFAIAID